MDKKLALTILFNGADKLSGSLKNILGLGEKGGTALARMRREAKDLDRQLSGVRNGLASGSGNVTGLLNRERELVAAIKAGNLQYERRAKILAIDNKIGLMQARGGRLTAAGQSNLWGGVMMAAPFVLAAKGAMEFSSGLVDLQQKAELTNRQMIGVRANIIAAAQATHQLPEDMRSAVDVLAGFGMDVRQASQLAQPIGRLGTAFKVDLADGAAAAFANINNLKVAAGDTGKAFDIMAAGGNAGAFEIKDMARYFPALTAQAQALGMHGTAAVADLTAALQIARRGAGDAEGAATNVADLMSKINAPVTINAFKKNFGIDLPNALKRAYAQGKTPLEAIADITSKAVGGAKHLDKLGFAFRNQQARMAITKLIQDMGDYKKMRADIAKSGGTVDRAFAQREANDGALAWKKFSVQLSVTALTLGGKLLPVASQFLGIVSRMLGAVGDFAQANPRLTTALLYLAAGAGAARLGLGALQFVFGGILGPGAQAWGMLMKFRALGGFGAIMSGATTAFGVLRTAVLFLAQGVMRAGLMLLANPIILVITAIVVVVGVAAYLIYKHWDTIKAAFWAGIAGLGKAWNWIKSTFMRFPYLFGPLGVAVAFIVQHWDGIKAAFGSGIAWLKALPPKMLTIGRAIITGLLGGIDPFALTNRLLQLAKAGVTAFKNYFGIKSPSRLFMQYGGHMTEGLAQGVERGQRRPIAAVGRLAASAAGAMALGAGAPAMAGGGGGALSGGVHIGKIEIKQLPGEDAKDLVKRVVDEIERRAKAAKRGAYSDD